MVFQSPASVLRDLQWGGGGEQVGLTLAPPPGVSSELPVESSRQALSSGFPHFHACPSWLPVSGQAQVLHSLGPWGGLHTCPCYTKQT